MNKHILMGAFAGLMLASGVAVAQDAQQAPGPKPDVKKVEDWFVRCFPVNSPTPCDMYEELDDQRTRQRVVSLSVSFVPSLNRHGLTISVPLEVSIAKGLVIQTGTYTSPMLKYRMCTRDGCFVQMAVDNSVIDALARSGPDGKINIVADSGKAYSLNFSLKGFAAAHDEMVAQAKVKAKPVEQSAAPAAPAAATP